MKNSFFTPFIITLLLVVSCKDASPQSREEIKEAKKALELKNLEQFFLGATKLCLDSPEAQCCKSFVFSPYINPMEVYLNVFENNRTIFDNQNNPFKLKEIREDMKGKIAKIRDKAIATGSDNLVYEVYGEWSIDAYDFDKEQLKINSYYTFHFKALPMSFGSGKPLKIQEFVNYRPSISMSANEAEKVFDYYEGIKEKLMLGPTKPLNTRITYSLHKPEPRSRRPDDFIIKPKKVELFLYGSWSDKIGEFTF
ncbi:DUF4852 domain-containing protein [Seonamhaeicola sp. MEBiC1930]|uniref:hypothetical protein n=1 Tax=Seonamhaeicola sp. MEBiC01930 TaxID=2976768 RepID=UPI003250A69A